GGSAAAPAQGTVGGLPLYASNPGQWGNGVCVNVSLVTPQSDGSSNFNLQVLTLSSSGSATLVESYTNLNTSPNNPQYAVTVIDTASAYISFGPAPPTTDLSVSVTPPTWVAAGYMTPASPALTPGDTLTQAVSGATATLLAAGLVTTESGSFIVFVDPLGSG